MPYSPPVGSQVNFVFVTTGYTPPVGSEVPFDFSGTNNFTMLPAWTGELAACELLASVPVGIVSGQTGEVATTVTIAAAYKLTPAGDATGEVATLLSLNTTVLLPSPTAQTGELATTDLTPGIPPNFGTVIVPTGEVASGSLKTTVILFSILQTGEVATASLITHPHAELDTNVVPTGEQTANTLTAFVQFASSIETGEVASCVLTVTGPTIATAQTGETCTATLNTGFTLLDTGAMFTGESIVNTSLLDNPAWHPTFVFQTGEKANLGTMQVFYHAVMTATARTGEVFWAATDGQTRNIDLAFDRNPPDSFYTMWDTVNQQQGPWVIIDLYENQHPEIVHQTGINQFATCQLSIRPRFFAVASEGQTAKHDLSARILGMVPGTTVTPAIPMRTGQSTLCQLEANIKVPLCFGNIIPDSDNVFIEMSSPYGDGCESWWFRTGETCFVARGGFVTIVALGNPIMHTGEVCSHIELQIPAPWAFQAWTGEYIKPLELVFATTFTAAAQTGEKMTVTFQDMTANAQTGERAFITSMHTNYDVFLDERGCMVNQYVPQTPDGDNDFAHAPPSTPRELDPFQHFILSHCE